MNTCYNIFHFDFDNNSNVSSDYMSICVQKETVAFFPLGHHHQCSCYLKNTRDAKNCHFSKKMKKKRQHKANSKTFVKSKSLANAFRIK